MLKNKKIILCILSIIMLVLIATTSFAQSVPSLEILDNNENGYQQIQSGEITPGNNATDGNNTNMSLNNNNNTNTNINANTNINNSNNNKTELPSTGIDYSIIFVIGICVISIAFAYSRIKKYNI